MRGRVWLDHKVTDGQPPSPIQTWPGENEEKPMTHSLTIKNYARYLSYYIPSWQVVSYTYNVREKCDQLSYTLWASNVHILLEHTQTERENRGSEREREGERKNKLTREDNHSWPSLCELPVLPSKRPCAPGKISFRWCVFPVTMSREGVNL